LCYSFGHLNIVYFAGPGRVEDLSLRVSSITIFVNWKKPSSNSDSVTNYIIEWVNTVSGIKETGTVTSEEDFFFIENLDACVEYAVSVTAVDADGVGDKNVTGRVTTRTAGNYHTHIILLCL
jgi:hypothetical protein